MKQETLQAVVLSDNKELQTNLEKENITDLVITNLKEQYSGLEIKGMDDKEGYKAVDDARKEVKRIRLMAEKIVKNETDKAFQAHKLAVADGKKVLVRFAEIEDSLSKKQKVIDDENKRIEEAEKERKKKIIAERQQNLLKLGYTGDLTIIEFLSDDQYAEKLGAAQIAYDMEQGRIAEEKRLAKAESDRLEKVAAEQKVSAARLEKLAAETKAESDRIAREQSEREAKIKAAEEAHANKLKAESDAKIREVELEAEKKAAAEKALADAETKRVADAKAEEERIATEKTEAERKEAMRPDKDKILAFAKTIVDLAYPECSTEEAQTFVKSIHIRMNDFASKIAEHANKIL